MQAYRAARVSTSNWSRRAIYADRGIVVLNKPSGLVCQGSKDGGHGNESDGQRMRGDKFNELLQDLEKYLKQDSLPHPVHRLDKSCTGALVFARNTATAREISQQFLARTVEKTYLALVRGGEKSFPGTSGEIRDALEINDGRVSIGNSCSAKFAATDWELIGHSPEAPLSLLRLRLHTGLKHQLRVHLAHALRTPILGDTVYTRSTPSEKIAGVTTVPENRIFLHASHISLNRYRKSGPSKRFRLGITAPLPKDFVKICADTGIRLDSKDISGGLFIDGEPVGEEIPDIEGKWLRHAARR
ncbi:hypothetical protein SERLA73DRAFT_165833 [Serpula lacrymans var. lacrymans S7.3]|uniref:Pseudouridine synthase RsuA/RluA-like domain-containing protein n=2 Tax=Serpula lacrymans var. lacrymans TaxID=341189 RepID=F8PMS4_SERL3|nr:uncharacterized protein SERLADRAFT_459213 [Serpula lacrymans var. lacrymans S7.9]EGO02906.1 hypothetical protein SERLA73DRAFT_165833 [Serpula lacrymans var. lacrymans S7.3]EGO28596.1 hypothetical protein SERLADRAFT_459213 [Serpula lacrymans var. lacrymans S7.9]